MAQRDGSVGDDGPGSLPWRTKVASRDRELVDGLDDALRRTDAMALVLDPTGRIVAHNQAWLDGAAARGDDPEAVGIGADYLAICSECPYAQHDSGPQVAAGVRRVLAGEQRHFALDYESRALDGQSWYTVRASQLAGPDSGVLVTHVDITAVHELEHAVRGRVHRLWEVVDPGADFVLLIGPDGKVLGRTDDRSRSVQWPVPGELALEFIHPADLDEVVQRLAECCEVAGRRREVTCRARKPGDVDGWRHFHAVGINMLDDPEVQGIVVAVMDLTERLRSSTRRTLSVGLMDQLPVAALATDDVGIVIALNSGASSLLGTEPESLLGLPLGDFVESLAPELLSEAVETTSAGRYWVGELEIRRGDGRVVPIWMRVERILDRDTGIAGYAYVAFDHSEQRRLEETLSHRERFDTLTGLSNRASFLRRVDDVIASLRDGEFGLVALIDLDRLRDVNTTHGSHVGDAVLRVVGEALEAVAGPGGAAARLYGDLFAVAVGADRTRAGFGEDLRRAIEVVEPVPGLTLPLSASIGIRLLTAADREPAAVVEEALSAAQEIKAGGGSGVRHFDDDLRRVLDERLVLRRDLPLAITDGQLAVEYQPIVRLDDGVVVGAEALVRWDHPTMGRISPDRFISIAEHSGLIHELGAVVLDDACRNAARWRDTRPEVPLSVAVNVSAAQLSDVGLPDRVRAALDRYHLDPASITLELTESMIMDDSDVGHRRIARLKATGVRLAVDDFGTGYSSLARLKFVPLDVVKIDRSFVDGIGADPDDASVVRTIVDLAGAFGIDVVAEGVETMDQASALRAVGCTKGQGFVWSASVPPDRFDGMLRSSFPYPPATDGEAQDFDRFEAFTDALRTIQHELATPLAVLNTTVSMQDPSGGIPRELHGTVKRSVHRVARLVESLDLLDRLDRGTLHPRCSEVDLALVVRRVAEEIGSHSARPVEVDTPQHVDAVVDGPLVEQVVTNLLNNAMKYSPHTAPVRVTVAAEHRSVRIEVHDRGVGIPPDKVGTIWRKFGRLDHSVPGSGVGLYLARGVARAHGGDLRYRAGEPDGSVFVLELPDGRDLQA